MPLDVRRLRPSELVAALNYTPLGDVIDRATLARHRARAGLRIGDGRTIDLLRYVAWLVTERHRPTPAADPTAAYDAHRQRVAQRQLELSARSRELGHARTDS